MDNTKYHKGLPDDTPLGSWRKVDFRLKLEVAARVLPVVVSMARARGHDVVFTPPHHSDLQLIEMVWAKVKGDVGVQYTVDTTFADVRPRLDVAFAQFHLSSDGIVFNTVRSLLQTCTTCFLRTTVKMKDRSTTTSSSSDTSDSDSDL
ncbi:hypothetical protein H257_07899 [Aphanomyces astaci]|uniref:Tc1-like transposase DDE domain-containing protein n=1 Tax=Aphanomyces astaci TaxID=112090 RepID=W4GH73_APHAT|nr:hypothetical protein H257_07899 [Aphanomyces astaci]ETV78313.1 hypothetical protein H257_07899 [Aphanomyces astaci]|eukprot:XP_009831894.1 hypothetical protein H257_07899 [Aphanomyces astaci]